MHLVIYFDIHIPPTFLFAVRKAEAGGGNTAADLAAELAERTEPKGGTQRAQRATREGEGRGRFSG